MDIEKVRAQAVQIMDEFMKSLDAIKGLKEEYGVERDVQLRNAGKSSFPDFRGKMFRNAKKKNDDYIIAGKRNW